MKDYKNASQCRKRRKISGVEYFCTRDKHRRTEEHEFLA